MKRLSRRAIDGATSRTLLVVEDPDGVVRQAVAAGATESSGVSNEHGWRLGRIIDPFGHEWEIGTPCRGVAAQLSGTLCSSLYEAPWSCPHLGREHRHSAHRPPELILDDQTRILAPRHCDRGARNRIF